MEMSKETPVGPSKDTMEVGRKLVELCKKGDNMKAVETLYSPDIESIEAMQMPGMGKEKGLEAAIKKNRMWMDENEVNSMSVEGPFPLGDRFAVHYKYDTTNRKSKERMKMEEVALYQVKNGKIVKEEFFYTM
ncbi:nuclear transport factor 2 family protein [Bdellovibrio svalbardensis]|uniref:Nuclear transport factor 2 family protein n=1 Tax=Bdellovibrio svalbardensis TaxID=2972972 RepID=A0ABT6DH23_9BACT|nr:nuclear transport factor 2 family protein [Bdellovibrio svalbardensis]MDG0815555.1 nuclear transport factor 2 family protein [Bdellovibrio svalbardensis]